VVGLLDYGQVKKLKEWERLLLAEVYIALADGDKAELLRLSKLAGYRSKRNDADVLYSVSVIGLDQDGSQVTGGLNIQQYMDKLYAQDPWDDMLDVFVMPSRMSLLLRGVGLMLNHPVSVAKAWRPIAEKLLQDYRDRHDGKLDYQIG
jgi:aarF domain-containing kinase